MNTYRELWHDKKNSWLESKQYPSGPNSSDVAVKSMHSLISLGTERLVTSQVISREVGEKMKVPHMKGGFSDKLTYGYSLVGEIVHGPDDLLGEYVHLLHPHQEMAFISDSDVTVIPNGISPKVATLASNMETAVNAVWDAEIDIGDRILIVGYGLIGALIASLLVQIPGLSIAIVELNNKSAERAMKQGFEVVGSSAVMDKNFDAAFNTSADEAGLQLAIDSTITDGKVIEVSWYGSKNISIELGGNFHYGRKRIISSQVSNIPAHKKHNWTFDKRKDLVFNLLQNPKYNEFITHEIQFEMAPAFFNKMRKNEISEFSTLINYNQ